jgi:hypothetical protein
MLLQLFVLFGELPQVFFLLFYGPEQANEQIDRSDRG